MPQGTYGASSVKDNDVPTRDISLSAKRGGNVVELETLSDHVGSSQSPT